jgi:hypothetical protein
MRRLLLLPFVLLACEPERRLPALCEPEPSDPPASCEPEPASCSSDAACPAGHGCDGTVCRPWCVREISADCVMPPCLPENDPADPLALHGEVIATCFRGDTLHFGHLCRGDGFGPTFGVLYQPDAPLVGGWPLGGRAWQFGTAWTPCVAWHTIPVERWPFAF